jgi:hypothetical protein
MFECEAGGIRRFTPMTGGAGLIQTFPQNFFS